MKKAIIISMLVCCCSLAGCTGNKEVEQLKEENMQLKDQIKQIQEGKTDLESAINQATGAEKKANDLLEIVSQKVEVPKDGSKYYTSYFKIKNKTDRPIKTLTLNIAELDDNGDIISGTHPQDLATVQPGQSITLDGLHKIGSCSAIKLDSFSFDYADQDTGDNYVTGSFKDTEKLALQ